MNSLGIKNTKELLNKSFAHFREVGPGGYAPLCLWGHKGVGKTALVNQFAETIVSATGKPARVISMQFSAMQPFELSGYPFIDSEKVGNKTLNVQKYATPWFLAEAEKEKDGYVIWFFDEINRAKIEMHNAIMGYLDGRGVNGHNVPKNVYIVCAANPLTEDAMYSAVTEITDAAILGRMIHVNVNTKVDEFLEHIQDKQDVHKSISSYILSNQKVLDKEDFRSVTTDLKPAERDFYRLGQFVPYLINNDKLMLVAACGILGDTQGALFVDRFNMLNVAITPDEILNSFSKVAERILSMIKPDKTGATRLDEVSHTVDAMRIWMNVKDRNEMTNKQMKNLQKFLDIIPSDMREVLLKQQLQENEMAFFGKQIMSTLSENTIDATKIRFR